MREPAGPRSRGEFDEETQRVFDVVSGPNLRKSDNMIQLIAIASGVAVGAIAGAVYGFMTQQNPLMPAIVAGFVGMVPALFVSGTILGMMRTASAFKPRK